MTRREQACEDAGRDGRGAAAVRAAGGGEEGRFPPLRAARGPGPASTPALDLRPLELWQALEMGHDGRELHRPSDGSHVSDGPGSAPPSGLGDCPPSSLSPWGCGDVHCSQFTCV